MIPGAPEPRSLQPTEGYFFGIFHITFSGKAVGCVRILKKFRNAVVP